MINTPKYYTQKLRMLELIEAARPGDPLPTERELAEQFHTSRTTIRQALAELFTEGRIERVQGSGTFVADPPPILVRQLTSFSEDLTGSQPGSTVLGSTVLGSTLLGIAGESATAAIAAKLDIPVGAATTRVERVRQRDDEPLAHEIARLPGHYEGLAHELERLGSLYRTLREAYGIVLGSVDDEVSTELANPAEAALLGIEVGQPLLVVCRTARAPDGAPVEHTRSVFRGDRFRFRASASRE